MRRAEIKEEFLIQGRLTCFTQEHVLREDNSVLLLLQFRNRVTGMAALKSNCVE